MVRLNVVVEGVSTPIEADEGMKGATDEQIISFAAETLGKPLIANEFTVERTAEGILIHPRATYG